MTVKSSHSSDQCLTAYLFSYLVAISGTWLSGCSIMRALLPMGHLLPDALRIAVLILPISWPRTTKEAWVIIPAHQLHV